MTIARKAEIERPNCPLYNDQKLKLGLFGTNCSNGLTVSHADTTYRATWEHSLAIARRADAMGFEMLVPIARWRGFGGTTDFNGICPEKPFSGSRGERRKSNLIAEALQLGEAAAL
jgi:dimethylsulfone monooxygenase